MITVPTKMPYYYMLGEIFILADEEGALEAMKTSPQVPVVNQKTIDLILELTRAKATAEGKLKLLGNVIQEVARTELLDALNLK